MVATNRNGDRITLYIPGGAKREYVIGSEMSPFKINNNVVRAIRVSNRGLVEIFADKGEVEMYQNVPFALHMKAQEVDKT